MFSRLSRLRRALASLPLDHRGDRDTRPIIGAAIAVLRSAALPRAAIFTIVVIEEVTMLMDVIDQRAVSVIHFHKKLTGRR